MALAVPYLALRVLQQVATDEGADFLLAVPTIRQHIYVDDCVFGADDVSLARQTREQLVSLLRAGFQLRKWASNNPLLLTGIDPKDHGLANSKALQVDDHVKVLEIKWTPCIDVFQFEIAVSNSTPKTKREILSTIAEIFDPLGWPRQDYHAEIVVVALSDWDDVIPDDLLIKWQTFYLQMPSLREISIPRWTGHGSDTVAAKIHGLADASTSVYGTVVYLKLTKIDGSVQLTLLSAKSKVAPLKPMNIPRLELCAAVLLARTIVAVVRPLLNLSNIVSHCWADSAVVFAWVNQYPSRWKVFVVNRVHEVQSQIPDAI